VVPIITKNNSSFYIFEFAYWSSGIQARPYLLLYSVLGFKLKSWLIGDSSKYWVPPLAAVDDPAVPFFEKNIDIFQQTT